MKRRISEGFCDTIKVMTILYAICFAIVSIIEYVYFWHFSWIYLIISLSCELIIPVTVIILSFLVQKHRSLSLPILLLSISFTTISVLRVFYFLLSTYGSVQNVAIGWIVVFPFALTVMILAIILISLAKPFSGEETKPVDIVKPFDLDVLVKAKELLDKGVITNEDFYEIKHNYSCL